MLPIGEASASSSSSSDSCTNCSCRSFDWTQTVGRTCATGSIAFPPVAEHAGRRRRWHVPYSPHFSLGQPESREAEPTLAAAGKALTSGSLAAVSTFVWLLETSSFVAESSTGTMRSAWLEPSASVTGLATDTRQQEVDMESVSDRRRSGEERGVETTSHDLQAVGTRNTDNDGERIRSRLAELRPTARRRRLRRDGGVEGEVDGHGRSGEPGVSGSEVPLDFSRLRRGDGVRGREKDGTAWRGKVGACKRRGREGEGIVTCTPGARVDGHL